MVAFDTAMSVHDDREHYQTLKYIFLSSTSYGTYLCGRAATRYLIALAGIAVNLCWLVPALHLPFAPDWAVLLAGCALGYLIGSGLGMVMASLFLLTAKLDTDVVEALFGGLFVMSGALFPPTAFPPLLERIAEVVPVSGFIELMRRGVSGVQFTGFLVRVPLGSLMLRVAVGAGTVFVLGVVLVGLGSRQAQRKGYVDMTTAY
jgi:ABC-2 type transport system permease protein